MNEVIIELKGTPEENSFLLAEMTKLLEKGHTLEEIQKAIQLVLAKG